LDIDASVTESPLLREAGRELLSLALIDARNHTLRLFAGLEAALAESGLAVPLMNELNPPLWLLGHIGWYQEAWIARNMQRQRGERCDPTAPRLASIEPNADRWYDASYVAHDRRWQLDLPSLDATRLYLLETLNTTLELLETAPEEDDALYFYRLALFHEDMQGEALARMAQTLDIGAKPMSQLLPQPAPHAARGALFFPATQWSMGMPASQPGFVFDNERWAHDVPVPEFEIDAQPVSWAQYAEFVEDGGYDEARWWLPAGWEWLQRSGRRTPRHVEQLRHGVLARRFGQLMRVPMQLPAMHVNWYEADAWCRWAGRRLPAEVEWEAAACSGASRGFHWGEVWEWTASSFRPYPGFSAGPDRYYSAPWFGSHKALRGASFATRARMKHPKFRNFQLPERDDLFVGFRSCAA
jgi:gamma-glutamyl hercynylcysteine S-oxide synthase